LWNIVGIPLEFRHGPATKPAKQALDPMVDVFDGVPE